MATSEARPTYKARGMAERSPLMDGDQIEQETEVSTEDRALDPRGLQERKDRRLRWAQVVASSIDAAAKLADIALRLIL